MCDWLLGDETLKINYSGNLTFFSKIMCEYIADNIVKKCSCCFNNTNYAELCFKGSQNYTNTYINNHLNIHLCCINCEQNLINARKYYCIFCLKEHDITIIRLFNK